jgi:hypothetical protein
LTFLHFPDDLGLHHFGFTLACRAYLLLKRLTLCEQFFEARLLNFPSGTFAL